MKFTPKTKSRCILAFFFLAAVILTLPAAGAEEDPNVLFDLGVDAFNAGDYEKAIGYWEDALPLYRANKDLEHQAMVLNNIGLMYYYTQDYAAAVEYFYRALEIDRERGIYSDMADDLMNLGMAAYRIGMYYDAGAAFLEAAQHYADLGMDEEQAKAVYNLARTYYVLDDYETALSMYIAAAELHGRLGKKPEFMQDMVGVGDIMVDIGRVDKALDAYDAAFETGKEEDDSVSMVWVITRTAVALGSIGRYDDALERLKMGENLLKNIEEIDSTLQILTTRADILDRAGDYTGSIKVYEEALELAKEHEYPEETGKILTNMGIVYGQLLRFDDAESSFSDARLIYQVLGDGLSEAKVVTNLGKLALEMKDADKALEYFFESNETFVNYKQQRLEAVNLLSMAEVLIATGNLDDAADAVEDALSLFREIPVGTERYVARSLSYLGFLKYMEGEYTAAVSDFNESLTLFRAEGTGVYEADALIGMGMSLLAEGRTDLAAGYFTEAQRRADELSITGLGWRAVYAQGLLAAVEGDDDVALARYEDALFRFLSLPEIGEDLLGARMINSDDLIERLAASHEANGLFDRAGTVREIENDINTRLSLFSGANGIGGDTTYAKEYIEAVGVVRYYEKKLSEDAGRGGDNQDMFTILILKSQGEVLSVVDEVKKKSPTFYETYMVEGSGI